MIAVEIPDALFYGAILVVIPSVIGLTTWLIRTLLHVSEMLVSHTDWLDRIQRRLDNDR
jgi:hypothetical protein